jgi:hypothetical protein
MDFKANSFDACDECERDLRDGSVVHATHR